MNNERQILNPLGMCTDPKVEQRPAAYFPTMTTPELVSYAESFAATALEKELLCRLRESYREDEAVVCAECGNESHYCHVCGFPV